MRFKMENRIQILSTRPIQQSLIKDARDACIDIDELTFIETNPIQSKLVDKEIENTLKETQQIFNVPLRRAGELMLVKSFLY